MGATSTASTSSSSPSTTAVDDGYLPAPVTMAAAIAGRTQRIMINIAAILVPLHDPVRLAEQLAVPTSPAAGG